MTFPIYIYIYIYGKIKVMFQSPPTRGRYGDLDNTYQIGFFAATNGDNIRKRNSEKAPMDPWQVPHRTSEPISHTTCPVPVICICLLGDTHKLLMLFIIMFFLSYSESDCSMAPNRATKITVNPPSGYQQAG